MSVTCRLDAFEKMLTGIHPSLLDRLAVDASALPGSPITELGAWCSLLDASSAKGNLSAVIKQLQTCKPGVDHAVHTLINYHLWEESMHALGSWASAQAQLHRFCPATFLNPEAKVADQASNIQEARWTTYGSAAQRPSCPATFLNPAASFIKMVQEGLTPLTATHFLLVGVDAWASCRGHAT